MWRDEKGRGFVAGMQLVDEGFWQRGNGFHEGCVRILREHGRSVRGMSLEIVD